MSDKKIVSSPSRTYVAICNKSNFDGFYFRKFTLPMGYLAEGYEEEGKGTGTWSEGSGSFVCRNTTAYAGWYFLNVLNFSACINEAITFEDYSNLKDEDELVEHSQRVSQAYSDGQDSAERRLKSVRAA